MFFVLRFLKTNSKVKRKVHQAKIYRDIERNGTMYAKMKIGLRTKICLSLVIIMLFVILSFILLNQQITSIEQSQTYIVKHDFKVHNLTHEIESQLIEMENNVRGSIISGDQIYISSYQQAERKWKSAYMELYSLLADNPRQQKTLNEVQTAITHWTKTVEIPRLQQSQNQQGQSGHELLDMKPGYIDLQTLREKMNTFRNTEEELTKARTNNLQEKNQTLKLGLSGLLFFSCFLSITLAILLSNSIVRTVQHVICAIRGITSDKGRFNQRIHVSTNDEIRELGEATNALLDNVEQREWLQTNVADMMIRYQGVSSLQELTERFLAGITEKIGASFGLVYVQEQGTEGIQYVQRGRFADRPFKGEQKIFQEKEGLVGQAAKEKRVFLLQDCSDSCSPITSGLGEWRPHSLIVVPIVFDEEVIAVVELASLQVFTDLQSQLLKETTHSFGSAIHSVQRRMDVQHMLVQSQKMTEELQTQSEELQIQSEELQAVNNQLEERTKEAEEKARDLQQTKKELELQTKQLQASSQYKSEFLANMSHELRTPLNSILILSEMLLENKNETLSEEEQEFAHIIYSAGTDLLGLINDVLDLSKIEAKKLEMICGEMSIQELCTQLERHFTPIAQQKQIDFQILLQKPVPDLFYTDEKRLQQIIKNMLSNAFKFTEQGSVIMQVEQMQKEQMTVEMEKKSDTWLVITCQDTGIGISEEQQQLIFDAFHQADGAIARKYGGTGLGLSISKELVTLLGGSITVHSIQGKGSIFTVYIPNIPKGVEMLEEHAGQITYEEVATSQNTEQIGDVPIVPRGYQESMLFQGKKVLIVDDDHRNRFALQSALGKQGITVISAEDGVACLDILEKNTTIDLVLMDIMMPHIDGFETMKHIRQSRKHIHLPIIALTAKAMNHDKQKCLQAGANDYVSKPVNLQQLFSVMRVWLTK